MKYDIISIHKQGDQQFNMQNFEKGHFFYTRDKNFFLFFMRDESPNAHESKSMIGFVPSAQQLTL